MLQNDGDKNNVIGAQGINRENPTAQLHIGPSNGKSYTASFKLDPGILLSVNEPGAIEYDGMHVYATMSNNARYQLDQQSPSSGLLSYTTAQRNALTPANGTLIYNTDTLQVQGYAGNQWQNIITQIGGTMTGSLVINTSVTNALTVNQTASVIDVNQNVIKFQYGGIDTFVGRKLTKSVGPSDGYTDWRIIGSTSSPAITSLIAPNGTDYADWTYDGVNMEIEVSTGDLNIRTGLIGGVLGNVNIWSLLGNPILKIGNINLTEALMLQYNGTDGFLSVTTGNLLIGHQTHTIQVKVSNAGFTKALVFSHDNINGLIDVTSGNLVVGDQSNQVKLRVNNAGFTQSIDVWNDGLNSHISSSVGSLDLDNNTNVSGNIAFTAVGSTISTTTANQGLAINPNGTGNVSVYSTTQNIKLRVGSSNFGQAFDFLHDGSNAQISTTLGNINFGSPITLSTALAVAQGGTGQTSYTDGQLLIGNSATGFLSKSTLTGTANQITVTNGNGSITLATPQNIHTGASPTFVGLTLSGNVTNTIANNGNVLALTINQNDTTNNPTAVLIANTGTGVSLDITSPNIAAGGTGMVRVYSTTSENADTGGSISFGGYITGTSASQVHGAISARKENNTSANTRAYMRFDVASSERMRIDSNGQIGFGGAPAVNQYAFSLAWVTTTAKTIGMERMTTANTAGTSLTITAQGAKSGATTHNLTGGNLILGAGISTGTAGASILFQTPTPGSDGTADNAISTKMTILGSGNIQLTNLLSQYNNISTTGWGIPSIYGTGRATAQVAANSSVVTYTVGASDGSFLISANVLVTASTTHSFQVECAYTDEGNTARVVTFNVQQLGGTLVTSITNVTGVGPYEGVPLHIRCKASTTITIRTNSGGTYTSVTYNVEGNIMQVA